MELYEREFFLSRILFGSTIIEANDNLLLYVHPLTIGQNILAQRLFKRVYDEALLSGAFTRKQMLEIMVKQGLWSEEKEEAIEKNKDLLEDSKIKLYDNFLRPEVRERIREELREIEKGQIKLFEQKHESDHLDCEGIATFSRWNWIVENTTTYEDGTPYDFNEIDIASVLRTHNKQNLNPEQLRELARTDPWRTIWIHSNKNAEAVFKRNPSELSDEQELLLGWSRLYDTVGEAHEPPPDGVIEDDDALDGWLAKAKRKREKEQNKFKLDGFDEKHQGADEVYIMANSPQEASEIHNLNDDYGKLVKEQRSKKVKIKSKKGKGMDYHKFHDVKIRKLNEANARF